MRGKPTDQLVELLQGLGLATAEQVERMAPRVRKLAGDLPDFESVWVDALAQARVLTTLQAAAINAGRGAQLRLGDCILQRTLDAPTFANCYAAKHQPSGRAVRLYLVRHTQVPPESAIEALEQLAEQLSPLEGTASAGVNDCGISPEGVWATAPFVDGRTAAGWMVENGRFPPQVVLHIARQMLVHLVAWERLGVVHGDIGAASLLLDGAGRALLPMPGLRGIVRPNEGYSLSDLPPEAYDYLAPERVARVVGTTIASDIYACGCLWWHLLTGRAPLAGGNGLAKLKAAHSARIAPVRELAPDTPEVLAMAIDACIARQVESRPKSFSELAEVLGTPTRASTHGVAACLRGDALVWAGATQTARRRRPASTRRIPLAGAAVATTLAVVLASAPLWLRSPATSSPGSAVASKSRSETAKTAATPPPHKGGETTIRDAAVQPATALMPSSPANSAADDELILEGNAPSRLRTLALKTGMVVRGLPGQRPRIVVPTEGLIVDRDGVRFDGVDFTVEGGAGTGESPQSAMLLVRASVVEFQGCSFATTASSSGAAIAWSAGAKSLASGGELAFRDCVFSGVDAVVECRAGGTLAIELTNSLCVAAGPLVRLHRPLKPVESLSLTLDRTTTRGDTSVLEYRYQRAEGEFGAVTINVSNSALDSNPQGGLLIFAGPQNPELLLASIAWNGQGSLVTPRTAMALWRSGNKKPQTLPEDALDIGGLVRSQVEFAGRAEGAPSASRVTRWQVPLQTDEPPGANPALLYLPQQ